jgi:hypothetical protein
MASVGLPTEAECTVCHWQAQASGTLFSVFPKIIGLKVLGLHLVSQLAEPLDCRDHIG